MYFLSSMGELAVLIFSLKIQKGFVNKYVLLNKSVQARYRRVEGG